MLNYKVIDNGKDKWVTFIHCLGGSIKTWNRQYLPFSNHFNLLFIDLPYHGESLNFSNHLTIENINIAIKEVLDHLSISHSHFISFSLGTIVISNFAVQFPEYISSIVLGGCSICVTGIYKPLVNFINLIKKIIPFKIAYKVIATIMLPKKTHKKSRNFFTREIKNMQKEHFQEWIKYISQIAKPETLLEKLNALNLKILIITGDKDFAFVEGSKIASEKIKSSCFEMLNKCGHICIIEKSELFNKKSLEFIESTC